MKPRPFLRSLVAGAATAFLLLAAFAGWHYWRQERQPAQAVHPKLDAPYVATLENVVERMLSLAQVSASDHVIDLGCGDGRILVAAASGRGASGYGVDIDPARIAEARANARRAGVTSRVRFEVRDLFQAPISKANVVALYLLPEINLQLRPRLLAELRPGTRIVSHAFDMGDWRPDHRAEADGARLYLWIVPARVAGRWTLTDEQGRRAAVALEQRYQELSGNVRDARLSGDRLRVVADLGGGARTFEGRIAGDRIEPLDAAARWRMERAR